MPENPSHQPPVTPGKEPIIYMVGSFYFAFIWFRVEVADSPPFFIGRCPKVLFKSQVTSHNDDTSRPLEKGRAEGAG